MDWILVYEILYTLVLIFVCLRIISETHTTSKTLSYLLAAVFVPFFGMIFYFLFGLSYRKKKIYSKKLTENDVLAKKIRDDIYKHSKQTFNENDASLQDNRELAYMLLKDSTSPLTSGNSVKLLKNGETKFPEVLQALREAKNHIHIEYYIYEDDNIGSSSGRRKLVPRLISNRVKAFPFYKIYFILLANRINFRNHRKIIVIDGQTAFVGGINVSDRYINSPENARQIFWRDTHLSIDGPGVQYLQYLFLCDWNFCSEEKLQPENRYFPSSGSLPVKDNKIVQIAASGPDSDTPAILYSILQAINLAKTEILISTPYFIPGEILVE